MRLALAVLLVVFLMGITALVVLWWSAPTPAITPRSGPEPTGWKKLTGAGLVGLGAYTGGTEGSQALAELSRGAGML